MADHTDCQICKDVAALTAQLQEAQQELVCTRSHPHEEMSAFCERLTRDARTIFDLQAQRDRLREALEASKKDMQAMTACNCGTSKDCQECQDLCYRCKAIRSLSAALDAR